MGHVSCLAFIGLYLFAPQIERSIMQVAMASLAGWRL